VGSRGGRWRPGDRGGVPGPETEHPQHSVDPDSHLPPKGDTRIQIQPRVLSLPRHYFADRSTQPCVHGERLLRRRNDVCARGQTPHPQKTLSALTSCSSCPHQSHCSKRRWTACIVPRSAGERQVGEEGGNADVEYVAVGPGHRMTILTLPTINHDSPIGMVWTSSAWAQQTFALMQRGTVAGVQAR
jgi:hypothetical protein